VLLYKKPGNPTFVTVPRRDFLSEEYVKGTLRICGCSDEEIDKFITAYRVH